MTDKPDKPDKAQIRVRDLPPLARNVRAFRRVREMTLDDLAEASKVSRTTIVNIENGTASPTLHTVMQLAKALHARPYVLVEDLEAESESTVFTTRSFMLMLRRLLRGASSRIRAAFRTLDGTALGELAEPDTTPSK
jgi:transcriptional regulator with XRE-family HTH domain